MRRIAYVIFSLPRGTPVEVEREKQSVRQILQQVGIRRFREAPMGFDFKIDADSPEFEAWLHAFQGKPDITPHIAIRR
ncbi:MAG: hypothetical protein RMM10_12185, partial [Anaerolineae bacterium]|uniref:hypothetical protein n=1 Tax=Thermoflexus sp. TaxID=1969742 RepID=UPI0025E20D2A